MVLFWPDAAARDERRNAIATANLHRRIGSSKSRFATVGYHAGPCIFRGTAPGYWLNLRLIRARSLRLHSGQALRSAWEAAAFRMMPQGDGLLCFLTEALLTGLAFSAAGHQLLDGFAGGFSLVQDGVHLLGDGHFHSEGTS